MRRIYLAIATALLFVGVVKAPAQTALSLKISEVVVNNPDGLIDEYGQRTAWIEIANTSWGTVNLRNCYLTNNRAALGEMSVPERTKLMSMVPRGDERTSLKAKEHIVFFADGQQHLGTLHTNFALNPEGSNFIALFDGDGHTLLDSVTVPAGGESGWSYARFFYANGKDSYWRWCGPDKVTPGSDNGGDGKAVNKIEEFKQNDPHGFGMAILGMGIVLTCLLLLSVFFYIFGKLFTLRKAKPVEPQTADGEAAQSNADDEGAIAAVIALALTEELFDRHDVESGVITIKHHRTNWTRTGSSE